jgi:hypothetical protein
MRLNGYGKRADYGALVFHIISVVAGSFFGTLIAGGLLIAALRLNG